MFSGLWHAHTGWLMSSQGRADWKKYAPDLYEDRGMRTISRQFPLWVLASLPLPL
jgi:stearoyl-CoA desaturase (delta-9 desaturase)